jgi:hypothetical protein
MVTGDRREGRPVDARGGQPLRLVGSLDAQPMLAADAGLRPQAVELRPAVRIELVDGRQRDVAMLRVDTGERG